MRGRGFEVIVGVAVLVALVGCSHGSGAASSQSERGGQPSCDAAGGAPAEFPIRASAENSRFPELDLQAAATHGFRFSSDSAVLSDGTMHRASEVIVVVRDRTATARVSILGGNRKSTEYLWEPDRYAERTDGGPWKQVDEPNAYEPPYRFSDAVTMMTPSMVALGLASRWTFAGTTPLGGVAYLHYCSDAPEPAALAATLALTNVGLDRSTARPKWGSVHLFVHPDGYVTELTSWLGQSDGTVMCWAAALDPSDNRLPSLDDFSPDPPQFESRFGSPGCDTDSLR